MDLDERLQLRETCASHMGEMLLEQAEALYEYCHSQTDKVEDFCIRGINPGYVAFGRSNVVTWSPLAGWRLHPTEHTPVFRARFNAWLNKHSKRKTRAASL